MSALDDLPPLREVIATYGLSASRSLGQNFILDMNLTSKIARAAGDLTGCDVVEVGPGPGGLTRALLAEGARHVVAIEKDERCLPALDDIRARYPGRLTVVHGDALEVDWHARVTPPVKIVANLPYNVGTKLLTSWLEPAAWPPIWHLMILMFQREVAERIVARPGQPAYGRLSVLASWRTQAEIVFDLPPSAFVPPPKVSSSVVRITLRDDAYPAVDARDLRDVVKAAFGQRRKMLRSSLKSVSDNPLRLLDAAGIPATERAENLTLEEFAALARALRAS